jgi:hypothetical protein
VRVGQEQVRSKIVILKSVKIGYGFDANTSQKKVENLKKIN